VLVIPAQQGALPVITGVLLPAVHACQVEGGTQAVACVAVAGIQQQAPPAVTAQFTGQGELGFGRRFRSQHVDDPADRIGAIQGAARPLADFDAAGLRHVDLVQRVMVEKAGGAGRDAILEKQVDRCGGQRLANGRGVAFAGQVAQAYAGHAVEHFAGVARALFLDIQGIHLTDAGGDFAGLLGFTGGRDADLLQVQGLFIGICRGAGLGAAGHAGQQAGEGNRTHGKSCPLAHAQGVAGMQAGSGRPGAGCAGRTGCSRGQADRRGGARDSGTGQWLACWSGARLMAGRGGCCAINSDRPSPSLLCGRLARLQCRLHHRHGRLSLSGAVPSRATR